MNFLKQQRQRAELLLMLMLGLICGSLISRLLQVARLEFNADVRAQTELFEPNTSSTGNSQPLTATTQRILCMITLNRQQHLQPHIERTWGKRCGKLIFLGVHTNKAKNMLAKALHWTHSGSWGKTRSSLQQVYTDYHKDFDWFLMVTDQTYIIMENLQHFLGNYAPEMPIYFDSVSFTKKPKKRTSATGGNIFSREALRRYTTLAHDNGTICSNRSYGIKHLEIARCFRNVGVAAGSPYDEQGMPIFVHKLTNITTGCCSQTAVSFECVSVTCFYEMDYMIYRLRPFGTS